MLICQNNKSRSNLRTAQNKKRRKKSQSMNAEREQSAASARNIIMKKFGVLDNDTKHAETRLFF
jgi:hypothetical protein